MLGDNLRIRGGWNGRLVIRVMGFTRFIGMVHRRLDACLLDCTSSRVLVRTGDVGTLSYYLTIMAAIRARMDGH